MNDPPEQSSSRDEQETMSSHKSGGQLSPVVLITTSACDQPEARSRPHEHGTPSSQVPAEPQPSPATTDTTPTISVEALSTNAWPEQSSPLKELDTMSSLAPAKPRLPFTGLDTTRTISEVIESGIQLSTEPVWIPDDSSRMRAPLLSSPASASRAVKLPPSPSSPVSVSRIVKCLPPPKSSSVFPIMKLPPELRLMVFDQIFLDLTVRRQRSLIHHNEVKLLEKHQTNDFRLYTNLLLTCNQLGQEAKNHWDKFYLQECCFYFWNVSKLYDLSLVLEKLGKPYTEIKYVLRSQCDEGHVGDYCLATTVNELMDAENVEFMSCQPGVSPDYQDMFMNQLYDRLELHDMNGDYVKVREGIYEATEENPVRSVVWVDEADRMYSRAEWSGPESCVISANATQAAVEPDNPWGVTFCHYQQMQGKFSGIFWGGYDPAVGYGKLKIWEGMPSCHGPNHHRCQKWDDPANPSIREELLSRVKIERAALLTWWAPKITADPKWLSFVGKPEELALNWIEEYGLEEWFDDEIWSAKADHHWDHWYLSGEPWTAIRLPQ